MTHEFRDGPSFVTHCDHAVESGSGWTRCSRCKSTCKRDGQGAIVEYTRGALPQHAAAVAREPSPSAMLPTYEA